MNHGLESRWKKVMVTFLNFQFYTFPIVSGCGVETPVFKKYKYDAYTHVN